MLRGLIHFAIHGHPNVATIKAFVEKLLRDYPSLGLVRRALDQAFLSSLETVKNLLWKHASPDLRVPGDNDEREAFQRLNLHAAMVNAKHPHWLVERMIELIKVSDTAVKGWSEHPALAADFAEDAWKNITPGLPSLLTKCTFRLANSVASLVPRQVRMNSVKGWLLVLNVCRDVASQMPSGHNSVPQELEVTFQRIISTLPMSDAQELQQQCLSFSTRYVDDCLHLTSAFQTWFRRANWRLPDQIAS